MPPESAFNRKAATDWLVRLVFLGCGALAAAWWQADLSAKDTFTREWRNKIDVHVTRGEVALQEFVVVKESLPRIEKQISDLSAKVDDLRQFVAREQGRREAVR